MAEVGGGLHPWLIVVGLLAICRRIALAWLPPVACVALFDLSCLLEGRLEELAAGRVSCRNEL